MKVALKFVSSQDWVLDRSKSEKDLEIATPKPVPNDVQLNRHFDLPRAHVFGQGRPMRPVVEDLFLNPNHEKAKPLNHDGKIAN